VETFQERILFMTKLKFCLFLNSAIVFLSAITAIAAEPNSVGNILEETGLDWLFGKWGTITDANQKIDIEFKLQADGYAISIEAKTGSNENVGLVYYSPARKTILYTGVDSTGRVITGPWEINGDKLVVNIEQNKPDGSITHYERYLSKVDADTMKSVTYSVVDGKRSEEPIGTLVFKRNK
jgi:hypothetical protein